MRTIVRNNYDPQVGDYHETIVIDDEREKKYIFDCDGVVTEMTGVEVVNEYGQSDKKAVSQKFFTDEMNDLSGDLADEIQNRTDADGAIWTEIENIEAASDVVDVVGTYAELQQYDTSKLHDNDLIKVLADETHDDEIAYYRWNDTTETFSYVGAEGPYYTQSQIDLMMGDKQDVATAAREVDIDRDENTLHVSLLDANGGTMSDFYIDWMAGAYYNADGYAGLVPQPRIADRDKFLKGDGTWSEVTTNTIFYMNSSETGNTRHIFKNSAMTDMATSQEVFDANDKGQVILRISNSVTPDQYSDAYLQNAYKATGDYQLLFLDEKTYRSFDTTTLSANTFTYSARVLQDQLTAGSNIQINGNTISATDTTYTAGTGIAITNNQIKALSVINVTFDSPSAGYAVLKSGTTVIDVMNVHNYFDRFGANVILAVTGNNEYATLIGELPADADGIHYLFEYGHLIYDFAVGLNDTKYTIIDTQAAMTGASAGAAGTKGLVPAPAAGDQGKFLQGDGTWATITVPALYTTTGQNTDGAVTQKLFTDTVGNIETALQILNSGAGVP